MTRSPLFSGRCYLCGDPACGLYCHACDWAAGEPAVAAPDPVPPLTLSRLHAYWLERHTPDQIVDLAAGIDSTTREAFA